MATNSFLGFSEDGSQLFEMKSKMARQVGDDASDSVKSTIRETLGVPASAEGLTPANNLSDVASAATSRTNLDVMATGDVNDRQFSKHPVNALRFDSNQQSKLTINDSPLLSFGDGSKDTAFSCAIFARIDDVSEFFYLINKEAASNAEFEFFSNQGKLKVALRDQSAGVWVNAEETTASIVSDRWYHFAFSYDGSGGASAANGITIWIDGVAVPLTVTNSGSYVAMENLNSSLTIGYESLNTRYNNGEIHSAVVFNREIDLAYAKKLMVNGNTPEVADQWGGSATYTSDFSSGVDGFTNVGVTTTGDYDSGDAGHADTLRIVAVDGSSDRAEKSGLFVAGQRYRLALNYKMVTGSSGQIVVPGNTLASGLSDVSWTSVEYEFIATTSGSLLVYAANTGSASDEILVDGIVVTPIGAVVALLPTPGSIESDGTWLDSSSNTLNGTPTGVTPLFQNPQPSGTFTPSILLGGSGAGQVYNTTNTFGHYQVLNSGTLCHVWGRVQFAGNSGDKGSGTGAVVLAGLPKASSTSAADAMPFTVPINNGSGLTSLPVGILSSGSTQATLYDSGSAGLTALNETNLLDSAILRFNFVYQIK